MDEHFLNGDLEDIKNELLIAINQLDLMISTTPHKLAMASVLENLTNSYKNSLAVFDQI